MNRSFLWKAIPAAVFVAAVCIQLFGPHPIGKSDNGDFPKVLGRLGIWVAPEFRGDLYGYFVTDYRVDEGHVWDPKTPGTEVWIARAAKEICAVLLPAGRFDIRVLGAVHGLLFLGVFWLCLIPLEGLEWKPRLFFTAVMLAVLADPQYVQFFSTAYMDTASLVFFALVFAVGWNASFSSKWQWGVAFAIAGSLFLGTKLQHQTCVIPLTFFCGAMAWRAGDRSSRVVWLGAPVVLAATCWFMFSKTPAGYRVEPLFSAIYSKIVPMAKSPEVALRELNRPARDISYVHMHAYSPGSPLVDAGYRAEFLQDVTTGRVLGYYWRHPEMGLAALRGDFLAFAADVPINSFGTMRRVDRAAPVFRAPVWQPWSWLRREAALRWPWHIWLVYLGVGLWFRSRLWALGLAFAGMGLLSFAAGSLLDATETSRHIILYQEATDFVFLVGLGMGFELLKMNRKEAKTQRSLTMLG